MNMRKYALELITGGDSERRLGMQSSRVDTDDFIEGFRQDTINTLALLRIWPSE